MARGAILTARKGGLSASISRLESRSHKKQNCNANRLPWKANLGVALHLAVAAAYWKYASRREIRAP